MPLSNTTDFSAAPPGFESDKLDCQNSAVKTSRSWGPPAWDCLGGAALHTSAGRKQSRQSRPAASAAGPQRGGGTSPR